jgi:hypothetical protein
MHGDHHATARDQRDERDVMHGLRTPWGIALAGVLGMLLASRAVALKAQSSSGPRSTAAVPSADRTADPDGVGTIL